MRRSKKRAYVLSARIGKSRVLKHARLFEEIQQESSCKHSSPYSPPFCDPQELHARIEKRARELCSAYALLNFRLDWMKRQEAEGDFLQFTAFPGKTLALETLETFVSHLSRELQEQNASVSNVRIVKGVFIAEIAMPESSETPESDPFHSREASSSRENEPIQNSWWSNMIHKWHGGGENTKK